ncbi:hypothetical protein ACHRV5_10165 [Flavobacterium sp. FlaQc-52]|uniref:hypothetical protein n=1 Tax=Flavobacterium sp. FlaQc-52 TaxID=3374185 RepID=UPI003757B5B8
MSLVYILIVRKYLLCNNLKIDLILLEQIDLTNTTTKLNIANTTTNLEGEVLSGFKIDEGTVSGVYDLEQASAIDSIPLRKVIISGRSRSVLLLGNDPCLRMSYQFIRSQNNSSTMEQGLTSPDVPGHTLADSYNETRGIRTVFGVFLFLMLRSYLG